MSSSMVGLSRSSVSLPKTKLAPKKGHGPCLVPVWFTTAFFSVLKKFFFNWKIITTLHYSFLNPGKTITSEMYAQQIDEMHWKTTTPAAGIGQQNGQFFSMTMPEYVLHNQCLKSWTNWAMKFCLIHYIHLTSCHYSHLTSSSILTIFWRYQKHFWYQLPNQQEFCCFQTSFQNQQEAENAFQVHRIPKHRFLHYGNKQTYFSVPGKELLRLRYTNQNKRLPW